jgi:hypothetical protein
VAEHLPSKCEALSLNPSTAKTNKKRHELIDRRKEKYLCCVGKKRTREQETFGEGNSEE